MIETSQTTTQLIEDLWTHSILCRVLSLFLYYNYIGLRLEVKTNQRHTVNSNSFN